MLKRTSRVVANDGLIKIEVVTKITVPNGHLVRTEADRLARHAARANADAIRSLPYTHFGPENTQVTV